LPLSQDTKLTVTSLAGFGIEPSNLFGFTGADHFNQL
jgi:hypothetical protein